MKEIQLIPLDGITFGHIVEKTTLAKPNSKKTKLW